VGCSFKNSSLGKVRPALLQELQEQPWCPHQGCPACAGSDHHQAHHEDGRSRCDRDDPGESLHACVTRMQLHIEWLKYESCVRNCQRDGSRPPATGIQV
jgi:hypothetical protein